MNPFIPLVDLKAQLASIQAEVQDAINGVLARGDFVMGAALAEFEKHFADFCGTKYAFGCASGTDALHLAVRAAGLGPGDEVLMPAMTFVATALGVSLAGATPVLVDVEAGNCLIDLEDAEKKLTKNTRAILPVQLFGQTCDMEAMEAFAKKHGLVIIEDAAQAHGSTGGEPNLEKRAGSFGLLGCFSFYPGKNLGAYGDGGCVTTSDPDMAAKLSMLRNWGSEKKYHHDTVGLNSRLDTIQAAVLNVKLARLAGWNQKRVEHARRYDEALADIPGLTLTQYRPGSVYHLYVVRTDNRDKALAALNEAGVGAGMHYPFAVHQTGAYAHLGNGTGSFPNSEDWAQRGLSLPIYAELPDNAAQRAADVLNKFA